jgi:NAD(P)-dependent dehydrogenase (short-subunit alcohol dehydrogenase family)
MPAVKRRNGEKARSVCRRRAIFLHQDVSIDESWPAAIETAVRRFGRLDVIVIMHLAKMPGQSANLR